MKRLILFACFYCMLSGLFAASVVKTSDNHFASVNASERAKAHFKENYAEVQDVAWYTAPDNSLYCIFHRQNTVDRVFYDSRGYWQFTLVSYLPSELKSNIRQQISDEFEGYRITYVNEIQSAYDEPIYMVNIENAGNIKVLKVTGDDIEVKQSLIKE
ncbi:MAG TPA: hypothetical protein VFI33_07905 [Puia sp.]|nr:hypothetical protein [Puia sp.]